MAFLYNTTTLTGTIDDDFILGIGGGPDHTINGGAGDDIIVGDHHTLADINSLGNNSIANAIDIDATANWYTGFSSLINNWAIPYTTVYAEGEDDVEVYSVTAGADGFMRLDIEFATFDTFVEILDDMGNVLASNDNSSFIDNGSSSNSDSDLTYTTETAGTYFVRVSEVDAGSGETDIEAGESFFLTVIVENHATIGSPASGDDTIDGGDGNDIIWAMDGDDIINGGAGDDIINPGEGIDTVDAGSGDDYIYDRFGAGPSDLDFYDGGDGIDTLDVSPAGTIGSEFNLITGEQTYLATVRDTFANIENIIVANSSTLIGDDNANELRVVGGSNVNILTGNGGDDVLEGGRLGDTIDGGDGFDFTSFLSATSAVTVNLGDAMQNTGDAQGDVYTSIEGIIGSSKNDTLTGDANDNIIEGADGNDTIDGADGVDSASYLRAESAVTVDLSIVGQQDTIGAGLDTLSNIEGLIGSDFADTLTGDANDNTLDGGKGIDTLNGGAGDDVIATGFKADIVDGGDGIDTIDYSLSDYTQTINLTSNININGHANGDILSNIENVLGSDFRKDDITGNLLDNVLDGQAGNDVLRGGKGDDTLIGGVGDDSFYGGKGADVHDGGDGKDWAKYNGSSDFVEVDLVSGGTAGIALGDTYINIENVRGTDFNDTISGNDEDNKILAGMGDDIVNGRDGVDALQGNDGNDIISGGAGKDTIRGQAGDDIFVYTAGDEVDKVLDFDDDGDDQIDLSSFGFTDFSDVQAIMTQIGTRVSIDFGGGDVLRLENTDLADMGADDFILTGGAAELPAAPKTVAETLPTLNQDLITEFMADNTIQSPIMITTAQGILEIMTDDDFGFYEMV